VPDASHANQHGSALRLGIVALLLSVTLFAIVDGVSKMAVSQQSFGQILLARYALGLPVLLVVAPRAAWPTLLKTKALPLQILRGLMPLAVGGLMVLSVEVMPLAEATVILFAGPFVLLVLAAMFLDEQVSRASMIGVAAGFAAILLVARPGLDGLSSYAILPAGAAFFYALLQLFSRQLGTRGEGATTSLAWTLLVGLIVSTPLAIYDWRAPTGAGWLLLILLGGCFAAAQYFMAKAYVMAPANILAPFTYSQILAAVVFGVVVFQDVPDFWTLSGVILIIGSGFYVYHVSQEFRR
jgi:drug/metabolite transporter (DMT)-like permease